MLSIALLALLLPEVPADAPTGAAPVELVRAVQIDAAQPERLRGLVELEPGRPLDREAIRRAVELIFATGRFEDVRVELVRDGPGPGVTVVFRPVPAPLLVRVHVLGDRVLSPRALARVARLRPGEPLWPARLERAGRDVALALERRGHLEALAPATAVRVPGGADAVFRIRAGPRVRVGRVSLETTASLTRVLLAAVGRPHPGGIYRREKAEAAGEEMRRRLVRSGHWRADVELTPTYDPGRATVDLVFHADPGPRMSLEVRGASLPQHLLATVRDLLSEGRAGPDALEAGGELIEGHLREQGHRDVSVRGSNEPRPLGEAIVYEVQPGPRASAGSVELRGADPALLVTLRTRPGRPLVDAALVEDERRLVSLLEARGHFEARVESEVPEGGGSLAVVFVARPGPRALVSSVEVEAPPLPTSGDDSGPQELAVRAGLPYRIADVARSRDTLVSAWRRAGYLDVRVRPQVAISEAQDGARVRLIVEPGGQTVVDHVVLAGLGRTRPAAVEREMLLRPGEPFSFERLLESQRRLSGLGIFERVSISDLAPGREQRDLVVSLQEAPRTTISWGLGYSDQDLGRGSLELTRRNLGGSARTASVFARGSFRGSRLLANLREPWLFGRKLDSFLSGFWEEERRDTYSYNRKGGILQAGRSLDPHTSVILRYLLQDTNVFGLRVPVDEIDRQYRTYAVSGPSGSVVFDTRDDPLEPKRGLFLGADLQLSLAALRGASFVRGFFQATSVRRLRSDLVLVLAGRLGLADGLAKGASELPLPERFFAGGDFGPRGFNVDGVGPQVTGSDGKAYAIGGNALLLGGTEMRYNVTRAFQLAAFLDIGNVYSEVREIALGDLRRSAGLGVRYRTPIGPVRLDLGFILDRRTGEPRYKRHLTIGYAF